MLEFNLNNIKLELDLKIKSNYFYNSFHSFELLVINNIINKKIKIS